MIAVHIDLTDRATPQIRAIERALAPERIKPVVGRAAVSVFREHLFAADNTRPNALGGSRTHFYADAARGTAYTAVSDGVIISVNQVGFRQRVLGGTIRPKSAKYLTIPARAEAHGKRADEFNDLVVVFGRGGQPVALARAVRTTLTRRRARTTSRPGAGLGSSRGTVEGGEIMYWLKQEVTQRGDGSLVPQPLELFGRVISDINSVVDRAAKQFGGAN